MSESTYTKLTRLRNDLEWNERITSTESAVLHNAAKALAAAEQEIATLEEEIEQLRFALETIAHVGSHEWPKGKLPEQVARDALENCQ